MMMDEPRAGKALLLLKAKTTIDDSNDQRTSHKHKGSDRIRKTT